MDMSEYQEVFKTESEEHLQQLNESLLELEQDPANMEHINIMFRSAHTLKGMAATMGFTTIAELTHEMENVMDKIRSHNAKLDNTAIDALFECLDTLEVLVEGVDSDEVVDISHLQCQLQGIMAQECAVDIPPKVSVSETTSAEETPVDEPTEIIVGAAKIADATKTIVEIKFTDHEKATIDKAQNENLSVMVAEISLDDGCLLKAARSTLVMRNISEIGNIIKTIPSVDDLEDENFEFDFKVVFSTKEDGKSAKVRIENVSEIKEVVLSPLPRLGGDMAGNLESKADNDTEIKTAANTKTQTEVKPKTAASAVKRTDTIKSVQSVRVSIERLDNLMNLVGELIINKIRLNQLASEIDAKNLDEALANLDRLTNEIQTEVMESRMVPIDQIFSRFPRMVRDLAKSEGKEINLVIEGKEIELDRTVLDEIGDPLVHLLRNSVDHGIEEKEKRTQLGKSATGIVRLAASRQRNNIVIEVEDDGKGMNPAHLKEIAIEKRILTEAEVNKLSDADALNLIFLPGFSGAETVTAVSGRGVGMDVVKTKIESLGGSVRVQSKEGEGSTVFLQLPLTVAIIQSLMVQVAAETYAIPLTNVIRDVGIKASDIKSIKGEEVIVLRGEVLPLLRLHDVLQCKTIEERKENLVVVIVEKMGNNIGIVVDELLGQQEVIIKTLESKLLKKTKGFAGATILGDGSVALILDIATLL